MSEEILESFTKLMMKDKSDLALMVMEQVADNCDLQQRIKKAINKLYCWDETLDSNFQIEMLSILQGEKVDD